MTTGYEHFGDFPVSVLFQNNLFCSEYCQIAAPLEFRTEGVMDILGAFESSCVPEHQSKLSADDYKSQFFILLKFDPLEHYFPENKGDTNGTITIL